MRQLVISQICKYNLSDYDTSVEKLLQMTDYDLLNLLMNIVVWED